MRLATIQLEITVIDNGQPRTRRTGGPMASDDVKDAMHKMVDAAHEVLSGEGFSVTHVGYGATAQELDGH